MNIHNDTLRLVKWYLIYRDQLRFESTCKTYRQPLLHIADLTEIAKHGAYQDLIAFRMCASSARNIKAHLMSAITAAFNAERIGFCDAIAIILGGKHKRQLTMLLYALMCERGLEWDTYGSTILRKLPMKVKEEVRLRVWLKHRMLDKVFAAPSISTKPSDSFKAQRSHQKLLGYIVKIDSVDLCLHLVPHTNVHNICYDALIHGASNVYAYFSKMPIINVPRHWIKSSKLPLIAVPYEGASSEETPDERSDDETFDDQLRYFDYTDAMGFGECPFIKHGVAFLQLVIGENNMETADECVSLAQTVEELQTLKEYGCTNFNGVLDRYFRKPNAVACEVIKFALDHGARPSDESITRLLSTRYTTSRGTYDMIKLMLPYINNLSRVYSSAICSSYLATDILTLLLQYITANPQLVDQFILAQHYLLLCAQDEPCRGSLQTVKTLMPLLSEEIISNGLEKSLSVGNKLSGAIEKYLDQLYVKNKRAKKSK